MTLRPMHYSFTVKDLASTRYFYMELLGCKEGRSTETWVDFDFFGNQLSAHISKKTGQLEYCGLVDGVTVPLPHFGAIVEHKDFQRIQETLLEAKVQFIIPPSLRFQGKPGEQYIMFFLDPSGNALEIKSFPDESNVFHR